MFHDILKCHLSIHSFFKTCRSDTVLRAISELKESNTINISDCHKKIGKWKFELHLIVDTVGDDPALLIWSHKKLRLPAIKLPKKESFTIHRLVQQLNGC